MFGTNKANKSAGTIDSLIGVGTVIEGNLQFKGGLRVDGEVRGSLNPTADGNSTLVVSEQGHVVGAVRAAHIVIDGTVDGPVYAEEFLELKPKARVTGEIRYRAIEMHQGALVEGAMLPLDSGKPGLKLAANNAT